MTTTVEEHTEEVGLRERKKQHTRAAIHDAAYRLIDKNGLEATTIEHICVEADVSSRTFFNYFPSKAAAALELPETAFDDAAVARFRAADGALVTALCDVMSGFAEHGPSHLRLKSILARNPELLPTLSQRMIELRGQFIALAAERAESQEQAELAVALVMAAMGRLMHQGVATGEAAAAAAGSASDALLPDRLRAAVDELVRVNAADLQPRKS